MDSEISNTIESLFSDKLILFHVSFLFSTAMDYYGQGWSRSPRRDLSPK
ncbi:DUF3231 family protein [Bacillus sp. EB600]|nr:DUF3231 family protein [Bacillus sp. EB600]